MRLAQKRLTKTNAAKVKFIIYDHLNDDSTQLPKNFNAQYKQWFFRCKRSTHKNCYKLGYILIPYCITKHNLIQRTIKTMHCFNAFRLNKLKNCRKSRILSETYCILQVKIYIRIVKAVKAMNQN